MVRVQTEAVAWDAVVGEGNGLMNRGSVLRLLSVALLWGSSFLWIKLALRGFSPGQIVLARLALGALCLLAVCWLRGFELPKSPRLLVHLTVAAVFANSVPYLLYGIAEQRVDSGTAGVLNASTPLWTILFALAARQERVLGRVRGAGLLLGFAGTLLCVSPWHAKGNLSGALICLAAAACYGVAYVYTRRFLTGHGITPIAMVATQLVAATGLIFVATPFIGAQPVHFRADAVIGLAILGAFGTGLAYVLNYRLTVDDGSTAASTVTYLLPIVSVLLGVAFLGETLRWYAAAGTVIALAGVMLARRTPGKQDPIEKKETLRAP
jgi:drug/metabolite transporter (DMT)-like permease